MANTDMHTISVPILLFSYTVLPNEVDRPPLLFGAA